MSENTDTPEPRQAIGPLPVRILLYVPAHGDLDVALKSVGPHSLLGKWWRMSMRRLHGRRRVVELVESPLQPGPVYDCPTPAHAAARCIADCLADRQRADDVIAGLCKHYKIDALTHEQLDAREREAAGS
jgi:hypothetical protein